MSDAQCTSNSTAKRVLLRDICFGLQPELFSNELCVFTQKCLHMTIFFITQDYVLVFYWDAENAEASSVDDKAVDYVSIFWQNKDAEKERKKSQLTVLSATEVFLSMMAVPII